MFIKENIDTGVLDTPIPNAFIDIYMLGSDGDYVRVYLLGYRMALAPQLGEIFSNELLASKLNMSLDRVIEAWDYWEKCMIVKIHNRNPDIKGDFNVEFLDLRKIYLNNFCKLNDGEISSPSSYAEELNLSMFSEIEKIIARMLTPEESTRIIKEMNQYRVSQDMVIYAFEKSLSPDGSYKSINYTSKILRNWHDKKITSLAQARADSQDYSVKRKRYTDIFKLLGFTGRDASAEEKNFIDSWFEDLGYDYEIVVEACRRTVNTANPSVTYINGVISDWHNRGLKDLNHILEYEKTKAEEREQRKKNYSSKSPNTNSSTNFAKDPISKFRNFDDRLKTGEYTEETLKEIEKNAQERALNSNDQDTKDYLELMRNKFSNKK